MDKVQLHEMVDRLDDSTLTEVGELLTRFLEGGIVRRFREGQRVKLTGRDAVAHDVAIGEVGIVREADPFPYPPRVHVEFDRVGIKADVDPANVEPVD